jgi:hypothetical protein
MIDVLTAKYLIDVTFAISQNEIPKLVIYK